MLTSNFASAEYSTFAPLYCAAILTTAFYGVTLMQTFFYFVHFPDDRLRVKIFVANLWLLDTLHVALTVSSVYKYILSSATINPDFIFQYVPTSMLALAAQGFFVRRIYLFSGRKLIAPLVWVVLVTPAFVCGTMYTIKGLYVNADGLHAVGNDVLRRGSFEIMASIIFSFVAVIDVLIAVCMTFLLVRQWMVSNLAHTAHVLQRLTMFAVNTGIWTASFAVLAFIFLHVFPTSLLYTVFSISLGSVYCNTVLANLNARVYIRLNTVIQVDPSNDTDAIGTRSIERSKHYYEGFFSSPVRARHASTHRKYTDIELTSQVAPQPVPVDNEA